MGGGKKRERINNPEPFLTDESNKSFSKKRTKPSKLHQQEQKLISAGMSSKILKEALAQQKEIQDEADAANPDNINFPEEPVTHTQIDDDDDIDNFPGFTDTHSQYDGDDETIANLLQEVGGNHAQSVGFSTDGFATTITMRKMHLIWVTSRMHIEIYRYPAWSEVLEIETWCQGEGRIGTRRDWIIKDHSNGEVIGRATSKWVMMNSDTRRLQKVNDAVRDEVLIYCPKTLRLAFPEENNNSLKKIAKLDDPAEYSRLGLVPRRADLDMNKHVNNVTYIGWVLESIPQEVIDTHELQSITLDYRRECQHDDVVDSLTSSESLVTKLEGSNGSASSPKEENDMSQFLHILRSSGDGLELNRARTEWRKKPAKR